MTFDPRDRFDIPDDREPEHNIPDAVCDDVPTDDVSDSEVAGSRLHECGTCGSLIREDDDMVQVHALWHEKARHES